MTELKPTNREKLILIFFPGDFYYVRILNKKLNSLGIEVINKDISLMVQEDLLVSENIVVLLSQRFLESELTVEKLYQLLSAAPPNTILPVAVDGRGMDSGKMIDLLSKIPLKKLADAEPTNDKETNSKMAKSHHKSINKADVISFNALQLDGFSNLMNYFRFK